MLVWQCSHLSSPWCFKLIFHVFWRMRSLIQYTQRYTIEVRPIRRQPRYCLISLYLQRPVVFLYSSNWLKIWRFCLIFFCHYNFALLPASSISTHACVSMCCTGLCCVSLHMSIMSSMLIWLPWKKLFTVFPRFPRSSGVCQLLSFPASSFLWVWPNGMSIY